MATSPAFLMSEGMWQASGMQGVQYGLSAVS